MPFKTLFCPDPFSCGIRWNELLSLALSSLPAIKNQFKAGRRSPALSENLRRDLSGQGWHWGHRGKQDVPWLTRWRRSVTSRPRIMRVTHPTARWHTGCRRALTAGIYTGRDLWKSRAPSNSFPAQFCSQTSAVPTTEGLRAINAPTNCNRIYQIIYNIMTLHNCAAIFMIFVYLIIYAHLTYFYLYAYSIPVCLIWK